MREINSLCGTKEKSIKTNSYLKGKRNSWRNKRQNRGQLTPLVMTLQAQAAHRLAAVVAPPLVVHQAQSLKRKKLLMRRVKDQRRILTNLQMKRCRLKQLGALRNDHHFQSIVAQSLQLLTMKSRSIRRPSKAVLAREAGVQRKLLSRNILDNET
jgi:hypothetical protein